MTARDDDARELGEMQPERDVLREMVRTHDESAKGCGFTKLPRYMRLLMDQLVRFSETV